MARGVNMVILLGNLGDDPDTRTTKGGNVVTRFSLATTMAWTNREGEKQEETSWHRCVAFGKTAEIIDEYARKGSQLHIVGRLKYGKYTDNEGVERYTTDVVVESFQFTSANKREDDGGGREQQSRSGSRSSGGKKRDPLPSEDPKNKSSFADDFADDDIPF